jgi:hypothetical protein
VGTGTNGKLLTDAGGPPGFYPALMNPDGSNPVAEPNIYRPFLDWQAVR